MTTERKRVGFKIEKDKSAEEGLKKVAETIREKMRIGDEDFEYACFQMLQSELKEEIDKCKESLGIMGIKELLGKANHNFLHFWLAEGAEEELANDDWQRIKGQYSKAYGQGVKNLLDSLDRIRASAKNP